MTAGKIHFSVVGLLILAAAAGIASAQELRAALFEDVDQRLAAAQEAEAPLLAPISYGRGLEAYQDAGEDLTRGRNVERIRSRIQSAMTSFDTAIEASEIAAITLAALIKTRDDALNANAPTFAAEQWLEAEDLFDSAARRYTMPAAAWRTSGCPATSLWIHTARPPSWLRWPPQPS